MDLIHKYVTGLMPLILLVMFFGVMIIPPKWIGGGRRWTEPPNEKKDS